MPVVKRRRPRNSMTRLGDITMDGFKIGTIDSIDDALESIEPNLGALSPLSPRSSRPDHMRRWQRHGRIGGDHHHHFPGHAHHPAPGHHHWVGHHDDEHGAAHDGAAEPVKKNPFGPFPASTGPVDRSSFADKLNDPAFVHRMASMTKGEVGLDSNLKTQRAITEQAFNRWYVREQPAGQDLYAGSGGYYDRNTFRQTSEAEEAQYKRDVLVPVILGGTNEALGTTGNASNAPGNMVAQHQFNRGTSGYWMDLRSGEKVNAPNDYMGGGHEAMFYEGPFKRQLPVNQAAAAVPSSASIPAGDIRMAPGRTAQHMELSTIDPRLKTIVGGGAAAFEAAHPGYTVEAFSGRRHNRSSSPHASESGALDMQIRDPSGNVLESRGSDPTGHYKELAQYARGVQMSKYPSLSGDFNWGGAHETKRGSGSPDLMHFDLSGVRGHFTPNLITNLPPKYSQPKVSTSGNPETEPM
jgi:hypothetical protein